MSVSLDKIIEFIEHDFADINSVAKWDFSGRQVYLGDKPINKVLISLDATENVITEAINKGCELVITHHPLFFGNSAFIDIRNNTDKIAIKAIQNNITILSYHTNIDISKNGINHYLAKLLNANVQDKFLSYEGTFNLYKFIVYVPFSHLDKVEKAITMTNKLKLGDYTDVSFISSGLGRFTPLEDSSAYIGDLNTPAIVEEVRIETITNDIYLQDIITAVKKVHPYQEVAYDILKLENSHDYGFGIVAELDKKYSLPDFIKLIKTKLQLKNIRTNMEKIPSFNKVAISSGSSVSSYKDCIKRGVKVLLTGDLKHHDAIDAATAGVCIIDGTHQYTESLYMTHFAKILNDKFSIQILTHKEKDRIISWE